MNLCPWRDIVTHIGAYNSGFTPQQLAFQVGRHTDATWFTWWTTPWSQTGGVLFENTHTFKSGRQGSCDGADVGQKRGRTGEVGSRDGRYARWMQRNRKRRSWHEYYPLVIVINVSVLLCLVCCVNLINSIVCFFWGRWDPYQLGHADHTDKPFKTWPLRIYIIGAVYLENIYWEIFSKIQ